MANSSSESRGQDDHRHFFAADIYKRIAANKSNNVVFSPASIQTCLALLSMGADGTTANEMRNALKLDKMPNDEIAENYLQHLTTMYNNSKGQRVDDKPQLIMANRIYLNKGMEILKNFNDMATKKFQSQVENLNFGDSANAATTINSWIECETNNKIQNLVDSNDIKADTTSILVNAIYFKAKWTMPFNAGQTRKEEFSITKDKKTMVDMMSKEATFCYAESSELNATAVQLDYENSKLKMIIILPIEVDGLQSMESKLNGQSIHRLRQKMMKHAVKLHLPKFRIEFDVDLQPILKDMGMQTMFSDAANFSHMIGGNVPLKIDKVKHKAFLDVNEAGSEAAAATFAEVVLRSMKPDEKLFNADHPFVFVICSRAGVFFAGHVTFQ